MTFCKTVKVLGNRLEITDEKKEEMKEIFEDELKIKEILSLAKVSMGTAFSRKRLPRGALSPQSEMCLSNGSGNVEQFK